MKIKPLIFLCIVSIILFGCEEVNTNGTTTTTVSDGDVDGSNGGNTGDNGDDINLQMTPGRCEASGGLWNECGSPCAGTDAEVCIQVCNPQCECGGIAGFGCPDGFSCRLSGRIADEIGVCV